MTHNKTPIYYLFILFLLTPGLSAELYHGIKPYDNFRDVKAIFPKANYERLDPAWATESDVLYSISGDGLSGKIIIKFDDGRPRYKKLIENNTESDPKINGLYESLAMAPDEEALSVSWVRWVPPSTIPLKRFILKYGKPDKIDFDDTSMTPFNEWSKKGITVYLKDKKNV